RRRAAGDRRAPARRADDHPHLDHRNGPVARRPDRPRGRGRDPHRHPGRLAHAAVAGDQRGAEDALRCAGAGHPRSTSWRWEWRCSPSSASPSRAGRPGRRILATKMRLLAERREADPAPDDAALEAYLDLHADRYREPERTSLWHVFVSSARGTACERDARALLARLRADAMPTTAPLGDPFPFGAYVRAASPRELAQHFGEAFAAGVARLPVGEWAGPVASPYGLH